MLGNTKYVRPPPSEKLLTTRPKDPTPGFTGFVPRNKREPATKEGGYKSYIPRPPDPTVGFTGFGPKY